MSLHTLLLEDDPLMQRFVSLALDETDNLVTFCQDVPQALAALTGQRFDFILTDLMLPGESGLSFIRRLAADTSLARGAEIVALSAGIDSAMMSELTSLGVQKQLLKPVSVKALQAVFVPATKEEQAQQFETLQTVDRYFGGQHALFAQFKNDSLTLLSQDIKKGDQLLGASDFSGLHQLAHSLKSVLLMLGEEQAHSLALALELELAQKTVPEQASRQWHALRAKLSLMTGNVS